MTLSGFRDNWIFVANLRYFMMRISMENLSFSRSWTLEYDGEYDISKVITQKELI